MIQKVSFRNFKAYRSLDLELEPLTVLVGPNASGKTTLLQGLHLAASLAGNRKGVLSDPVERSALSSYGSKAPTEWSLSGVWGGTAGIVHASVEPLAKDATVTGQWAGVNFQAKMGLDEPTAGQLVLGRMFSQSPGGEGPPDFQDALLSTSILRFEAQALAKASYSEEQIPEIDGRGDGLASLLAYLKLSQDEVFDGIEQALKQIVPSVRRIRIERAAVERTTLRTIALDEQRHQIPEQQTLWGNRVVLDMKGAKGVAADSAGEGTLMVLGLLTVLMGPSKPRLVLLDDIELNLHPVAQGKLIETLRTLQKRDPELQIIATSHSPFILNYLKPEEVRMTFLAENGFARCEKLTAHPEFERWKDLMSPGEFWSTVGESWMERVETPAGNE
ncbi:AAA family ATPase [Cystobacter fuscus]|uniref:AAA family ATPase n=1 Tax=Cystobacter fuscus TaxID=43 RepID=UPI00138AB4EB|nr:ATP-binding protein [Cystobacter fuscus]